MTNTTPKVMNSEDVAQANEWLALFDVALCLVTGENGLLLGMVNKGSFSLIGTTLNGHVEVHITPPLTSDAEVDPIINEQEGNDGPPSPSPSPAN